MKPPINEIKQLLDDRVKRYNSPEYIENDPIYIPHLFTEKHDIEIAGFLAATLSWGQRVSILNSAKKLLALMDYSPADYVKHSSESDLIVFSNFVHRTFNGEDCIFFIRALKRIYEKYGGLEGLFSEGYNPVAISDPNSLKIYHAIHHFQKEFFNIHHPARTRKHIADPARGSSAKRINMFLRWMVRKDDKGVDFGMWNSISMADLICPLDVHSGNIARKLGLLKGNQNNWKAAAELTNNLRLLDPEDPVKYDFALFGLGIYENF